MAYDAFISYSHAADEKLAPALQRALRTLAKPWYRLRSLRVFRDETDLSAASDLTGIIRAALSSSRYFIYLASPDAAKSKWVGDEIEIWKKRNLPENLLIALTDGYIEWDSSRQRFNWEASTALHPSLQGVFSKQPLWVDLRWAKGERNLSPRDPRFQHATAMLAAPIHEKTLDELVGEDVYQYRRTRVLMTVVGSALVLLLALSLLATRIATKTTQTLQSKNRLLGGILLGEDDAEDNSELALYKRVLNSITTGLLETPEMAEWIHWGPGRLAVADDCFTKDRNNSDDNSDVCPKSRSEFDENGLRMDIPGLNAMAMTLISSLDDGRIKELLFKSKVEEKLEVTTKDREDVEHDLVTFIEHAGIILPDKLWMQRPLPGQPELKLTRKDNEWFEEHASIVRYFSIWRKTIGIAGKADELILIQFIDGGYCGSGGCTSPIVGFLRVGEKYKIIFAQVSWGRLAIYDTVPDNLPDILTINESQSGAFLQYRTILRYSFYDECECYLPNVSGSIKSFPAIYALQEGALN